MVISIAMSITVCPNCGNTVLLLQIDDKKYCYDSHDIPTVISNKTNTTICIHSAASQLGGFKMTVSEGNRKKERTISYLINKHCFSLKDIVPSMLLFCP